MWMEELKNGKYKYFERYKDPYTEQWRRVSVTLDSGSNRAKKEAQKLLDEKINSKVKSLTESDMALQELYDLWFPYYKKIVKRNSWIKVPAMMIHIFNSINPGVKVKNVDTVLVDKLIEDMYIFGNYSLNYSKQVRTTLSTMLNFAVSKQIIENNPVLKTKIIAKKQEEGRRQNRIEDKYLEKEEAKRILDYLYSNKRRITHAKFSEILLLTGLRYGEFQAMQLKNYDGHSLTVDGTLDYNAVKLEQATKTTPKNIYSRRIIELPDRAIQLIDEIILENKLMLPDYNEDSYIFLANHKRSPLAIQSFNAVLHAIEAELGFQKSITSHIFRHSHISYLAESNVPLKAIMERVGHADPETTLKIYNHVTKKSKEKVLSVLNAM